MKLKFIFVSITQLILYIHNHIKVYLRYISDINEVFSLIPAEKIRSPYSETYSKNPFKNNLLKFEGIVIKV